jgi:hypothetical protein
MGAGSSSRYAIKFEELLNDETVVFQTETLSSGGLTSFFLADMLFFRARVDIGNFFSCSIFAHILFIFDSFLIHFPSILADHV